ncbi:MAG TPA: FecR domain-containing protein [Planctomycetota bacterium]|nr:FecR domain-containing protein [Planctomycetota bacterium]
MNADRFDELLSLYVDGRATEGDLAELEGEMRRDPSLRRAFVERVRLDVTLTALLESSVETGAPASGRRVRAPRRATSENPGRLRAIGALAAALFIAALLMLVLRDGRPVPAGTKRPSTSRTADAEGVSLEEARRVAVEEQSRAEGEQHRTEERLASIQRQEAAAIRDEPGGQEPKAPADEVLARLRAEREAAETELQEARRRERQAALDVERTGKGLAAIPPRGQPSETRSQLATLDRVEGDVRVPGRPAATAGQALYSGDGLVIAGPRSFALVSTPDRTRMEFADGAVVREFTEARVVLEKGSVKAEVAHQPKDRPLVFATPHGDAKVLGTLLRLSVDPDPKRGTSLEVQEGRVELRSLAGKSVLVDAGHQASIAAGAALTAKPLGREEVLLALDVEDGKLPASVETGTVEAGPPRLGNRYCLAGVADSTGASKLFIGDGGNGLFTFAGDEILSFDYWTDPQASQVNFNFWDRSRKIAHEGSVPKLVVGKWTHVTVRLADLGDAGTRLREGDWVVNFYIQSTGGASRRFYIDNVVITRMRTLKPRSK